ncbi:MAG: hypothetical protein ACREKH_13525, partial [Candidatus Rokuibacteriota bacterium]
MRAYRILAGIMAALLAAITLHACGGDGEGGPPATATATVSSYVTDDLGGFESVVLTLNSVQLRHTSGRTCEIIRGPLTVDAAELGRDQLLERVDTMTCEAGPYNRLFVELDDDVTLRQTDGSPPQSCKFVSYVEDGSPRPNRLACANGVCSLNITGAVNLVARVHEHVALDADLKEFTVDTTVTPCEVTLKVSPLHAAGKLAAGFRVSLVGTVSNVDAAVDRFALAAKGTSFTVQYAAVTDQPGLDTLLGRAAADGLRTIVRCQTIVATTPPTCTAQTDALQPLKAITVKAGGTISALDTGAQTFTLNYGAGTMLPVNYAQAAVAGTLANGAVAEVKLYGANTDFLARDVEV